VQPPTRRRGLRDQAYSLRDNQFCVQKIDTLIVIEKSRAAAIEIYGIDCFAVVKRGWAETGKGLQSLADLDADHVFKFKGCAYLDNAPECALLLGFTGDFHD